MTARVVEKKPAAEAKTERKPDADQKNGEEGGTAGNNRSRRRNDRNRTNAPDNRGKTAQVTVKPHKSGEAQKSDKNTSADPAAQPRQGAENAAEKPHNSKNNNRRRYYHNRRPNKNGGEGNS